MAPSVEQPVFLTGGRINTTMWRMPTSEGHLWRDPMWTAFWERQGDRAHRAAEGLLRPAVGRDREGAAQGSLVVMDKAV